VERFISAFNKVLKDRTETKTSNYNGSLNEVIDYILSKNKTTVGGDNVAIGVAHSKAFAANARGSKKQARALAHLSICSSLVVEHIMKAKGQNPRTVRRDVSTSLPAFRRCSLFGRSIRCSKALGMVIRKDL
jgi:hypothetical protein